MSPAAQPFTDSDIPAYPPVAHTSPKETVRCQPSRSATMSTSRDKTNDGRLEKMDRMRGGCIPCPDGGCCYIIPIPCCC
ncbi:hypothetical protein C8F01DRAFT_1139736 [Mycena amicta]|nr:hypothetical protein C8F01DRAFT_1139736 [Mycena amicta]